MTSIYRVPGTRGPMRMCMECMERILPGAANRVKAEIDELDEGEMLNVNRKGGRR